MADDNSSTWGEVELLLINLPPYADDVAELVGSEVSLPVLQDTDEADVAELYGAEKWYFLLVDREGLPRTIHYSLDLGTESDRLLAEIAELVEEGSK